MDKPKFVYVTYIATTPEKLWEALTSSSFTRQYFGGGLIESDWKEGSPVKLVKHGGDIYWDGKVLKSDPPRLLSYTFDAGAKFGNERPSRVVIELEPNGSNVKLTLTHDDFPLESKVYTGISGGWPKHLSSLKSLLEGGRPLELAVPCNS